jgi:hypothetical protein
LEDEIGYLNEKPPIQVTEEVLDQVGLVLPITYDGYNICELARLDKLLQFKMKELKEMCNFFELSAKARDTKSLLIERMKQMVEECS